MSKTSNDILRQWLNLIMAPAMWILSTLPQFTGWGRTAKEFSDANDSLLVPYGLAFAIWFPIFVGCIGYAVLQALGTNRTRDIFRKTGWWTAAGFTFVCGWALLSTFGSTMVARWGTALIFIPTVLCLVKAMLVFTRDIEALDKMERFWVWAPISLIAGWTSIAIFLNWTPIISDALLGVMPEVSSNSLMLMMALGWALLITFKSKGNKAYAFPIIWGLGFLVVKHLTQQTGYEFLAYLAIGAAMMLTGALVYSVMNSEPDGYSKISL